MKIGHHFRSDKACTLIGTHAMWALLCRDPLPAIKQAGFAIEQQHRFTVEGLGVIGPHQCGIAVA